MTTTTDLAVYEEAAAPALRVPALPDLPDVDSWIRAMASIAKLADKICDTEFVPAAMRGKPDAVTAAILTGRELGMPPMLALRTINMIKGTPSLSAEYKRAKVLSLGHDFKILEWDADHCKIAARRRGDRGEPTVIEYKMADARKAGLIRKNKDGSPGKYETDPMAMMLARATTRTTGAVFTDVVNGLATTELLEAGDADALAEGGASYIELPASPPPVADLKARAAAQTVTSIVVTPEPSPAAPDTPPSGNAATPTTPGAAAAGEARSYAECKEYIDTRLSELNVHDVADKLQAVSLIIGRPIKAANNLRPAEAAKAADTLEAITSVSDAGLLADLATANDPTADGDE